MGCHTVHVYVGCGGGFVYGERAPSYLLESYTVLLSCGFLNLFEVFYLASANQLFPSDYCYTVEKYMCKLWVCTASDPPTSPSCPLQQVPGEICSPSVLERINCGQVTGITIFCCHFTPFAFTLFTPDVFSPLGCLQAQTWLFSRLHLGLCPPGSADCDSQPCLSLSSAAQWALVPPTLLSLGPKTCRT